MIKSIDFKNCKKLVFEQTSERRGGHMFIEEHARFS